MQNNRIEYINAQQAIFIASAGYLDFAAAIQSCTGFHNHAAALSPVQASPEGRGSGIHGFTAVWGAPAVRKETAVWGCSLVPGSRVWQDYTALWCSTVWGSSPAGSFRVHKAESIPTDTRH